MPRLALISDTHLPERLEALPRSLFELLAGCDLVLHAGDVGDMHVLDELAAIAPVIAVRGNDGGTESAEVLPLEQLVVAGGTRILLWHGHFEDRSDELAWRHAAGWPDIFDRIARRGRARGASIVVTGHTHIPLAVEHRGVLLVNPGAVAPGNAFLVQELRSVATLDIAAGRPAEVRHIDVDGGDAFEFPLDTTGSFSDAASRVQRSLLGPEVTGWRRDLDRLYRKDPAFRAKWLELAHDVWRGSRRVLTAEEVRGALDAGGAAAHDFAARVGAPEMPSAASGRASRS